MGFKKVDILDNFYQTSSFYPMPVVLVTTVAESGITNIGSYSLCFPFGIAKEHYMMLISRGDSNTSLNLQRHGVCALNFIPYDRAYMKNAVTLGYPGETSEQKQKDSVFSLMPSMREVKEDGVQYPEIIAESIQVFECTWVDDESVFQYNVDDGSRHFLLRIDNVFMKTKWVDALTKGNGRFPCLPVDFGYRDSREFWFAKHKKPWSAPIPKDKGVDASTIKFQVERLPYDTPWDEDAYEKLVKVPRVFLKRVLESICQRAKDEGVERITPEILDRYKEKRR